MSGKAFKQLDIEQTAVESFARLLSSNYEVNGVYNYKDFSITIGTFVEYLFKDHPLFIRKAALNDILPKLEKWNES